MRSFLLVYSCSSATCRTRGRQREARAKDGFLSFLWQNRLEPLQLTLPPESPRRRPESLLALNRNLPPSQPRPASSSRATTSPTIRPTSPPSISPKKMKTFTFTSVTPRSSRPSARHVSHVGAILQRMTRRVLEADMASRIRIIGSLTVPRVQGIECPDSLSMLEAARS